MGKVILRSLKKNDSRYVDKMIDFNYNANEQHENL